MDTRLLWRRDRSVNWARQNPVLALGEFALEVDTKRWKIGDGVTNWNALEYREDYTEIQEAIDSKVGLDQLGVANGIAVLDASGKIPLPMIPENPNGPGGGISLDTDGRPYFDADGEGTVKTDTDGRPYFDFGA